MSTLFKKNAKVFHYSAENTNRKNAVFKRRCTMPVEGVAGSDAVRTEQARAERNSEGVAGNEEQRRVENRDRDVEQTRQAIEPGRGENMDVTA